LYGIVFSAMSTSIEPQCSKCPMVKKYGAASETASSDNQSTSQEFVVVVYRQVGARDGFTITARLGSGVSNLIKGGVAWRRK